LSKRRSTAKLQLKAAEAEYQSLRVTLQSNLMNLKAGAATVNSDYTQGKLQADTDKALYDLGVISGLAYKNSKSKADELTTRNNIEGEPLDINQKAIESQLAQQQAKVGQIRALAELKQKQFDALKVRVGIEGVLVDLPLQK
jgi:HlyD family secretion protein